MDVDLNSAVENMSIAHSDSIKTVLEAVVNSIQSCRFDDSDHSITIKIISKEQRLDGKVSSTVDGFEIIDDGVGFNDENYKSFCTIGSRLKKLQFGCKGVGRLTWLKVFSNVTVSSTYNESGTTFKREFTFNLKDEGIVGGTPTRLDDTLPNKTIIKLNNCLSEYKDGIQVTSYSLSSRIANHCISFYLDPNNIIPTIRVIHGDEEPEIVNDIWESAVSDSDQGDVEVSGHTLHLTHVKFYKFYNLKNGISLCADGLDVQFFKKFEIDLKDEKESRFRYRCFVSGNLLNNTVNLSRDGFSLGSSSRSIDEVDNPSIEEIINSVIPECEKYLKEYMDSHSERCLERLKSFIDTDIGKSFTAVLRYSPDVINSIKPDMTDPDIHKIMYESLQKIESELLFSNTLSKNSKVDISEAIEQKMEKIDAIHRDELTRLFVHRGLILSAFDERLEAINRLYPEHDEQYRMELESVIHDLILPRKTDSKNQPILSNNNLWILDERLYAYSFQGAYSDMKIRDISDCDSEDRPDIFIFGDVDDNMVAEGICIIEFKRPNLSDSNILEQINRYIDQFIDHGVYNYRNEKVTIDSDSTTFYCYAICDTNSDDFKKKIRHLHMNKKFGGRGYYSWDGETHTSYDIIDHHQVFADAKMRNKVFFELIGIEVGSDYVIVTKGDKIMIQINDKQIE